VEAFGVPWAELDPASQVSAAPDLTASSLAVGRPWGQSGNALGYTLTVRNTGNAPSASTGLTVTLPADLVNVWSSHLSYNAQAHQLTWQGAAPVGTLSFSFLAVVSPAVTACGQLAVTAALRDQLGQTTALAASVSLAVPDVDCNGVVDIVDVQSLAARWDATQGDPAYHPRYDLDGNGVIDVRDIIVVANRWNGLAP